MVSGIPKDLMVYADLEMMNTIFRNLIMNAIKFSNQGGKVEINATRQNGYISISVRDEGIGMNHEKLDILFDIAQKTSTLGTAREKGTGLGLALCKEFIEVHGGRIYAESEEGKGSTFRFDIPVHPSENAAS